MRPGGEDRRHHGVDERAQLLAASVAAPLAHQGGERSRGDDPALHRVLEVVADVGDPVGPAHHLALRRRRRRSRPRVVADAVEGLVAEVERCQRDVRTPRGVVEPPVEIGGQRVLAGMSARAVAAVVAEGDGLGEGHVEAAGPGDAGGHLGHLERVGQPGALVVVGEDEDLGLAGQATKGGGVEDAVAVAFEAGPPRIGLVRPGPVAGTDRPGGRRRQPLRLDRLALRSRRRPPGPSGPARLRHCRRGRG